MLSITLGVESATILKPDNNFILNSSRVHWKWCDVSVDGHLKYGKEKVNPILINDQHREIQRGNSPAIFTAGHKEPQKKKLQRKADGKEQTFTK